MNVVVLMDVSNTTRVILIPCSTPDLETVGLVNPRWLCMYIIAVHYNTYSINIYYPVEENIDRGRNSVLPGLLERSMKSATSWSAQFQTHLISSSCVHAERG